MCGIVGYLNLDGSQVASDEQHLGPMCASIKHRGPDECGSKYIGAAALGMTRLSIIDLASGQQPISNEDGSVWIVFNGEIYNFQELQKLVLSKGHKLRTRCDTEVIVHLYEEYGYDCLQHLEGMFAFAIWDSKKEELFIARDRLGEKPLHWSQFSGQFVFGSEIKGILAHPNCPKRLNIEALQKYLALEYVPAPESIFEGIHKLRPGHFLVIKNGEVNIKNYWRPEVPQGNHRNADQSSEELIELLTRSIKLRMIADVPLGIFLSGGIDSSSIAALAAANSSAPIQTFSIGFSEASFDESAHAQAVARHIGSKHECFEFEPDLAKETLEQLWNVLDEPIADASILPTFFLSKMTKKSVTVALSGEGGDELFGGYPTYQAHRLAGYWNQVPRILRKGLIEPAVRALPVNMNNLSFDYKLKRFISAAGEDARSRHLRWMGSIPLSEQRKLGTLGTLGTLDSAGSFGSSKPSHLANISDSSELFDLSSDYFKLSNNPNANVVDEIMEFDLRTYLPDDLLVKSDRASMAASLEVRLPFLAYPLVEFALSLPSNLKMRGLTTKYLLKKAMAPYLPARTISRPKKGFGIPVAKWLNSDFRALADELFGESFLRRQGLFEFAHIHKLLEEHRSQTADRRKELWTIFMFQCWWQKYFA
jgi:asparagine synthase (glutamine-hydrolysing)